MTKFQRPCLLCGALSYGTRCATHEQAYQSAREAKRDTPERRERKRNLYNKDYRARRKLLLEAVGAMGGVCHLCKKPFTATDRVEADHLVPSDPNSELAPAHRLCNQRRGNKPLP